MLRNGLMLTTLEDKMTVAELILWLQTQPLNAEVYIHDADTSWALPLHVGTNKYNYPGDATGKAPNGVFVHGNYSEHL